MIHPPRLAVPAPHPFSVHEVSLWHPWRWLRRGWADLIRCPALSLAHGLCLALAGALIALIARDRFWLLAGAFSGFLWVAPILATGLYALSRALQQGRVPSLSVVRQAWRPRDARCVIFGLLLALAGTGWVLTSAALITGFSDVPITKPHDFLRVVVLSDNAGLFAWWMALGALLAAPVFASSVVAVPLLLDQPVGVWTAVLTSWRAVMASPAPLALWAVLILSLTLLGMATLMLGLIVVLPWLGHASWHAYGDLVRVPGPRSDAKG